MAGTEAYCVKCRKTVEIKDPQETTMKNGRPATKGTCPHCGTGVFRIGAGSGSSAGAAGGSGASAGGGASGGSGASAGGGGGKAKSGSK